MKTLLNEKNYRIVLLILFSVLLLNGCATDEESSDDESPDTISGTVTLPSSASGKKVFVRATESELTSSYISYIGTEVTLGDTTQASYTIDGLSSGKTYYIYAFVDMDGDEDQSSGDFYGYYNARYPNLPTSKLTLDEQKTDIDITLYQLNTKVSVYFTDSIVTKINDGDFNGAIYFDNDSDYSNGYAIRKIFNFSYAFIFEGEYLITLSVPLGTYYTYVIINPSTLGYDTLIEGSSIFSYYNDPVDINSSDYNLPSSANVTISSDTSLSTIGSATGTVYLMEYN